jgi:hypothetical protein
MEILHKNLEEILDRLKGVITMCEEKNYRRLRNIKREIIILFKNIGQFALFLEKIGSKKEIIDKISNIELKNDKKCQFKYRILQELNIITTVIFRKKRI